MRPSPSLSLFEPLSELGAMELCWWGWGEGGKLQANTIISTFRLEGHVRVVKQETKQKNLETAFDIQARAFARLL